MKMTLKILSSRDNRLKEIMVLSRNLQEKKVKNLFSSLEQDNNLFLVA